MAQFIRTGPKHDDRVAAAAERRTEYEKLTVAQKLDKLDKKFGKNMGAAKQRKRLSK